MFYVILGIVVIVAPVLIFRDDREGSYSRSEKGVILALDCCPVHLPKYLLGSFLMVIHHPQCLLDYNL